MKICNLASGSKGNCTYIQSNGTSILIDDGLSTKDLLTRARSVDLDLSKISAIVVTHEHTDHIKGVQSLSKLLDVPVYIHNLSLDNCKVWNAKLCNCNMDLDFEIGNLQLSPFRLPHDSAYNQGYVVSDGKSTFAIATDLGVVQENVAQKLARAQCVMLESNHDILLLKNGAYPYPLKQRILSANGHLSNIDCAETAVRLVQSGLKNLLLSHLSEDNNTPELAFEQTRDTLKKNNIVEGKDVVVEVASQYKPSRIITI